jgi:predicted transcriptional regulator
MKSFGTYLCFSILCWGYYNGFHMRVILTFGPLEKEILEILWEREEQSSVRDVFCTLKERRDIAYTTVMTVLNRLVEKGALERCRDGKAHTYSPLLSRQDVICLTVRSFLQTLNEYDEDGYKALSQEFSRLPHKEQICVMKALVPEKK